jgi:hypothetical protein
MNSKSKRIQSFISYRFIFLIVYGLPFINLQEISCQFRNILSVTENCNSYILICGKSNINQFNFIYNSVDTKDIRLFSHSKDTGLFEVSIPIKDFEASNPLMYNDFLELMKAVEYPRINICLSRHQLELASNGSQSSCPEITITLAGITRSYPINCTIYNCSDKLYINGSKKIKFSDFNITPPEKLHGLVKVRDEIDVNFGFIVSFLDQKPALTSL